MSFHLHLDTPGTTILNYTPNGRQIITAGSDSAIRIFTVGESGEPKTVDDGIDGHLGIVTTVGYIGSSDFFPQAERIECLPDFQFRANRYAPYEHSPIHIFWVRKMVQFGNMIYNRAKWINYLFAAHHLCEICHCREMASGWPLQASKHITHSNPIGKSCGSLPLLTLALVVNLR